MNRLQLLVTVAALGVAGAVQGQTESPPQDTREPAAETPDTVPGTADPVPSTPQTEGTAADRSPPGQTPTTTPGTTPGTVNPMPATGVGEGTAADDTPPGETPVRGTAESQAPTQVAARDAGRAGSQRLTDLVEMGVTDPAGQRIGQLQDIVIDPEGRASHVIVARGRDAALVAVPWSAVQASVQQGQLVLEPARLQNAPSFQESRWPDMTSRAWSAEADRYWGGQGTSRSATGETTEPAGAQDRF